MQPLHQKSPLFESGLPLLLTVGIFVLDLSAPAGIDLWLLYAVPFTLIAVSSLGQIPRYFLGLVALLVLRLANSILLLAILPKAILQVNWEQTVTSQPSRLLVLLPVVPHSIPPERLPIPMLCKNLASHQLTQYHQAIQLN